jgi:Uma2 family endonuclease
MISSNLREYLPSSEELPCSDDTPVDNEDQNFIPNFLLFLLEAIWKTRQDWFFGVDMGVYHTTGVNPRVPVVPDGFLSLRVERRKQGKSRRSYVVWEENDIPPTLVLEVVSWTPGDEYDTKAAIYANLGVLYYIIYNPEYWQRDRHQPFEVYKLIDGSYELQKKEPFWMPEIALGIGRAPDPSGIIQREVLSWYDEQGNRYPTLEEQAQQAQEQAQQAQQARLDAIPRLLQMGLGVEQVAEVLGLSIDIVQTEAEK